MTGPKLRPNRRTTIQARAAALARSPKARVQSAIIPKAVEGDAEEGTPTAAGATAELWLYGVVGGFWWGFDAEAVAAELRALPDDIAEVRVRVHSPGGSALEGIAIMNLLANFPAKITVVVDGLAASAASVLILGGDDIVISPGSQVMIHDCSTYTYGNAAQLRSDADWIDKQSANYAEVYATRGGTAEQRREAMTYDNGRGTWYTATEAVGDDVNLGDRVGKIESVTPPPAPPAYDDWDEEEAEAAAAFDRDVLVANADVWAAWTTTPGAMPRAPKPPTASADGKTHTEGTAMSLSDAATKTLTAGLGLAETADEATILAAFAEALEEQADPIVTPAPPAPAAAFKVPEGFKLVDADGFDALKTNADLGAKAFQAQATAHRDTTIRTAVAAGKFPPARAAHFEKLWASDAEGTEEIIKALEPGLVPVAEEGHDQTPGGDEPTASTEQVGAFAALLGLNAEELAR